MFELHVQALTPIPKIISDGEVSIISKSGGSIVGKAASSTNVIKYPPNGLLTPTEKSFPQGFSKKAYSYQQSAPKVLNAWYEAYHLYEGGGLSTQSLITFNEYVVAPFKVGEESNNRNKTYVYLVKESLDTIEAFGGIGQYFTYAGRQGFLRYEMLSANQETYNLIWDDNGKVLTIAISTPLNVVTSKDVIALLTTLRRSNGKKLLEFPVTGKLPKFISEPVGIDPNFKGSSIEGAWGTETGNFGMPDVGINGLLVPSHKSLSSDYYYLRTNTERRNEKEGMVRYVLYANQSLTPMSLRFDMSSDKTYTSVVALKDMLTKGGQSGKSKVTRESFTYKNSKGVVYLYWHHNRLNYELHWDDNGKDVHIRLEHVPSSYQFSSKQLIDLLSTMRRSDGFYADLLLRATSTRDLLILRAGTEGQGTMIISPILEGLLVPTHASLKPHFGEVRQYGTKEGYELMYSPPNLENRFSVFTGPIIVFREFPSSNKQNSYEALSKKDISNYLHIDMPINYDVDTQSTPPNVSWPSNLTKKIKTFTYNGRNGVLYSYEGSTTMAYSLHYDDDGKDMQILIKNVSKLLYTEQEVIDILKTLKRSDGKEYGDKGLFNMKSMVDEAKFNATDRFNVNATSTWYRLKGFLGPTKDSYPKNYDLWREPYNDEEYGFTTDFNLDSQKRGIYRLYYYFPPDWRNDFRFQQTLKLPTGSSTGTPYEVLSKQSYEAINKERKETSKPDYKQTSTLLVESDIVIKNFMHKGKKGVLYSYYDGRKCLYYILHYDDNGADLEIKVHFCTEDNRYTPEQVISILDTLKRY